MLSARGRDPTSGTRGLVVTDHEQASLAGRRILKQGGNAADAAVAAAAALSVIDPYMCGFSGFGYSLFYSGKEDRAYALDFIGEAPAAASMDLYSGEKPWEDYKPTAEGTLAVLVPGVVSGWSTILDKFGSMKWKDVLAPAIELARGFRVSPVLYDFYERVKGRAMSNPVTARTFYKGGSFTRPGKVFVQEDLTHTLKLLAERGADDFYRGALAKKLVCAVADAGGIISEGDLARYETKVRTPVEGTHLGHKVFSHPPGSSGMTVIQWLNVLEGFDPEHEEPNSVEFLHAFLEAGKLALRDDDSYNTGKDYIDVPTGRLMSKRYAAEQRSKIDPKRAKFYDLVSTVGSYPGNTTHLCACDREGDVVSVTQTQMYGFDRVGVLGDLGFNLNGGMCYFSLDPRHVERLEPGQRPRYVMSPTIAIKEDRVITLGAAGGWTIPQTIAQTLVKILDFGMGVQEAVSSPRWVMRYRYNSIPYPPGTLVDIEKGVPDRVRRGLLGKGHAVYDVPEELASMADMNINFGAVNALSFGRERMEGGAETRRDGSVGSA